MAVQEDKLRDELLPELEFYVTPSKLTDIVRVDIGGLDDNFMDYLVTIGCIENEIHNDCQIMYVSKIPQFCKKIRDAFCVYNVSQSANV